MPLFIVSAEGEEEISVVAKNYGQAEKRWRKKLKLKDDCFPDAISLLALDDNLVLPD